MTTSPVRPTPLREEVAANIRALMGRHRISGSRLARAIDLSQSYLSRRLTGENAFDLDDLERIAEFFGVAVGELFPSEDLDTDHRGRTTLRSDEMPPFLMSPLLERSLPRGGPPNGRPAPRPNGHSGPHPGRPGRVVRAPIG
jgi:transcriptional regulator with XRE-family HTH domain